MKETYEAAKLRLLLELEGKGWISSNPTHAEPRSYSQNGLLSVWFKPRSIHVIGQPTADDYRRAGRIVRDYRGLSVDDLIARSMKGEPV